MFEQSVQVGVGCKGGKGDDLGAVHEAVQPHLHTRGMEHGHDLHSTVKCCSTVQYSTVQYSIVQYSTVQCVEREKVGNNTIVQAGP